MEINLFNQAGKDTGANTIFTDNDAEKRNQITKKLFDKRKLILSTQPVNMEDLTMNDLDLSAFGLTKVDYEIYLAKEEALH
jgi:hypothetical protein